MIDSRRIRKFKKTVWDFFVTHKRELPWRKTKNPYRILVSEIMLQQTQVPRVVEKYRVFLKLFPTVQSLAAAPAAGVLRAWQGLGYNRRALQVKKAAEIIVSEHGGKVPQSAEALDALPGIGTNTAAAICAYAYNQSVVFIETNIRKVFIHHFFHDKKNVRDQDLLPYIKKSLDVKNPRQWYWALMDYGSFLAKTVPNPGRQSKHYAKQAKFKGSLRQLRGRVLAHLLERERSSVAELQEIFPDPRLKEVVDALVAEKFFWHRIKVPRSRADGVLNL